MARELHLERDEGGTWHCPYCGQELHPFDCLDPSPYDLVELVCGLCSSVVIMERAVFEGQITADLPVEEP